MARKISKSKSLNNKTSSAVPASPSSPSATTTVPGSTVSVPTTTTTTNTNVPSSLPFPLPRSAEVLKHSPPSDTVLPSMFPKQTSTAPSTVDQHSPQQHHTKKPTTSTEPRDDDKKLPAQDKPGNLVSESASTTSPSSVSASISTASVASIPDDSTPPKPQQQPQQQQQKRSSTNDSSTSTPPTKKAAIFPVPGRLETPTQRYMIDSQNNENCNCIVYTRAIGRFHMYAWATQKYKKVIDGRLVNIAAFLPAARSLASRGHYRGEQSKTFNECKVHRLVKLKTSPTDETPLLANTKPMTPENKKKYGYPPDYVACFEGYVHQDHDLGRNTKARRENFGKHITAAFTELSKKYDKFASIYGYGGDLTGDVTYDTHPPVNDYVIKIDTLGLLYSDYTGTSNKVLASNPLLLSNYFREELVPAIQQELDPSLGSSPSAATTTAADSSGLQDFSD